jgi:hypothetical protein
MFSDKDQPRGYFQIRVLITCTSEYFSFKRNSNIITSKFHKPMTNPSGKKLNTADEREKVNIDSGHYILPVIMPKGSASTSLRPI